jgi:WD40 repeat protein
MLASGQLFDRLNRGTHAHTHTKTYTHTTHTHTHTRIRTHTAQVMTGSSDRSTVLWDAQRGVKLSSWPPQQGSRVKDMAFSKGGRFAALVLYDSSIAVWDMNSGVWVCLCVCTCACACVCEKCWCMFACLRVCMCV